jgi:hypothetical protein
MSEIEKTMLDATGIKPQGKTEARQKFLTRTVKAVVALDDDAWEGLEKTKGAQDWANAAIEADNTGKEIDDFPDLENEAEDEDVEEASGDASEDDVSEADEEDPDEQSEEDEVKPKSAKGGGKPAAKKSDDKPAKITAKKPEPKKPGAKKAEAEKPTKAAPEKKAAGKRASGAPSARRVVKMMIIKKPRSTADELQEALKKKGLTLSDLSVSSIRADTRDTIRALNEAGVTKIDL